MANYTHFDETTTKRIYQLDTPSNWAEFDKMWVAVCREFAGKRTWDDTVEVQTSDEWVRLIFEPARIAELKDKPANDLDAIRDLEEVLGRFGLDAKERDQVRAVVTGILASRKAQ